MFCSFCASMCNCAQISLMPCTTSFTLIEVPFPFVCIHDNYSVRCAMRCPLWAMMWCGSLHIPCTVSFVCTFLIVRYTSPILNQPHAILIVLLFKSRDCTFKLQFMTRKRCPFASWQRYSRACCTKKAASTQRGFVIRKRPHRILQTEQQTAKLSFRLCV